MKKVLIGLGVVVALLVVAAFVIPMLIPAETYREEIRERVRAATGRDLTINGEMSFQILPSIAFTAEDVTLANAPGGQAENMATLRRLEVEVRIIPLISGNLEIDRLVLIDPEINLEANAGGRPNWEFEPEAASEAEQARQEQSETQQENGAPGILRLGDVRIENGRIRYSDTSSGTSYDLQGVNLTLSLPDFSSPFTADGSITYNGQTVSLDARLDSPAALESENGAETRIEISGDLVSMTFNGRARMADALSASGAMNLDIPSLRRLMAWAGSPMEGGSEASFGRFAVNGQLSLTGSQASLSGATVRFDEIEGTGNLLVDTAGAVPAVNARLDVETLDLTPYMGEGATSESGDGAEGWSQEPFDTSALRSVNANLEFNAGAIRLRNISIGRSGLTIALQGGRMTATLREASLYEGNGQGQIIIDGRRADSLGLTVSEFTLTGLQARPFLRDAAGYDRLSGTANFRVPLLTGRGANMRQLMSSLTSSGQSGLFEFLNGSLRGFNVAAAVRHAGTLFTDPGALESRDTDFTRMGGTFTVANGILNNPDLEMVSPLLRLTGAGTANIGAQRVDYRLEPRAVVSLEGQGGREDLGGMVVPVDCRGPWANVDCSPDVTGLRIVGRDGQLSLPNPENLRELPDNLRDRVPENLRRFLPDQQEGQQGQDGAEGQQEERPSARDQIEGIIRGRRGREDGQQQEQQEEQQQEEQQQEEQQQEEQQQEQQQQEQQQQEQQQQEQQQQEQQQQEQQQQEEQQQEEQQQEGERDPRQRLRDLIQPRE